LTSIIDDHASLSICIGKLAEEESLEDIEYLKGHNYLFEGHLV